MLAKSRQTHAARKVIDNEQRFAKTFHQYTHFTPKHMKRICAHAKGLTRTLNQRLGDAFAAYRTCASIRRPPASRKVSYSRLFSDSNHGVQIDSLFVAEPGKLKIFHMTNAAAGLYVTALFFSRSLKEASKCLSILWLNVNGPPLELSADPDFFEDKFLTMCCTHSIHFKPWPARQHNKLGVVESSHENGRLLVHKLLK